MTITRAARAVGVTAAVLGAFGAAATPAAAAPVAAGNTLNLGQFTGAQEVSTDDVWAQFCLVVTAQTLTVFSEPSGGTRLGTLRLGEKVEVIGHQGNRYKVDARIDGWISADPQWTGPCP